MELVVGTSPGHVGAGLGGLAFKLNSISGSPHTHGVTGNAETHIPSLPTGHILQFWGAGTRDVDPTVEMGACLPIPHALMLGPTPPLPQPQQPWFATISVVLPISRVPLHGRDPVSQD